ncbi:hypothetical protein P9B04_10975, partial [Crocosphaera sp. Alani8]
MDTLNKMLPAQETETGCYYIGKTEEILNKPFFSKFKGQVQLLFTSPPLVLTVSVEAWLWYNLLQR